MRILRKELVLRVREVYELRSEGKRIFPIQGCAESDFSALFAQRIRKSIGRIGEGVLK